jgi:hypothetical protein
MPPNPSKSSRSSGSRSSTARPSSQSPADKPAPKASAGKPSPAKSAPKSTAAKPAAKSTAAKSTAAKPAPKSPAAKPAKTSSSSAGSKTTRARKTYKGQPGEIEGNRPGLALIVGRGIVKEDFYARLRGGTTSMKAATRGDVGLELSTEDIEVLKSLDWDSIDRNVQELRALLPTLKVRKDAASW